VVYNNPFGNVKNIEAEINEVFGDKISKPKETSYQDVTKGYTFTMNYADFISVVNKASKGFPLPKNPKQL
jgi:hypothetical protein